MENLTPICVRTPTVIFLFLFYSLTLFACYMVLWLGSMHAPTHHWKCVRPMHGHTEYNGTWTNCTPNICSSNTVFFLLRNLFDWRTGHFVFFWLFCDMGLDLSDRYFRFCLNLLLEQDAWIDHWFNTHKIPNLSMLMAISFKTKKSFN